MRTLFEAAKNNDVSFIEAYINAGGDVNIKDNLGNTALIWASLNGYTQIVELLLNANANTDIRECLGYTALDWASIKEYTEIVELLKNHNKQVSKEITKENTLESLEMIKNYFQQS